MLGLALLVSTAVFEKLAMAKKDQIRALLKSIETGDHTAFYDLFRFAEGRIVEHWDTSEKIAPQSEWKNDNGKF